jgi:hypothetical protein
MSRRRVFEYNYLTLSPCCNFFLQIRIECKFFQYFFGYIFFRFPFPTIPIETVSLGIVAGPRGLEPRSARLECDILPLNYGPKILLSRFPSIPKMASKRNYLYIRFMSGFRRVRISYADVPARRASSTAVICSLPEVPMSTTSSPDFAFGMSVTSITIISIDTRPSTGARLPRTSTSAVFESARGYPCQYPTGQTAMRVGRCTRYVRSYPIPLPTGISFVSEMIVFHESTGFNFFSSVSLRDISSDGATPYSPIPIRTISKCAFGKTNAPPVALA